MVVRRMLDTDSDADLALMHETFLYPPDKEAAYLATPSDLGWAAADGDRLLGGLKAERLDQSYGGAQIPSALVFGVKVAATARGRGIGMALLRQALLDLRAEGMVLVMLYPSDIHAYRKVGFEVSGTYTRRRCPVDAVPRRRVDADVVSLDPSASVPLLRDVYDRFARAHNGLVIRSDRWWQSRVTSTAEGRAPQCFGVPGPDGLRGYVLFDRVPTPAHPQYFETVCRDLVYLDADALAGILGVLADNRAVSATLSWSGPATDPLNLLIADSLPKVTDHRLWMTRVLDARTAAARRGVARGVKGRVSVRVTDEFLGDQEFDWVFDGSGAAGVDGLSGPPLEMDCRTFAALYTGYARAEEAARIGRLTTDPRAAGQLASLSAACGPAPWSLDLF